MQDIKSGGLRLADLETRICMAHISLIKAAWNNPTSLWAAILKEALRQKCTLTMLASKINWPHNLNHHYAMFRDTLKSWNRVHDFHPDTEEMVQREVIWNNKSILIAQRPVNWQSWFEAGIKTIADLLHNLQPRFLSHEEMRQKYGISCSFLDSLQLRAAIPVKWKRLLVSPAPPNVSMGLYIQQSAQKYLKVSASTSKAIYAVLIECKKPSISAQLKWALVYPDLDPTRQDPWRELYQVPYRAIRDTKYQAFQYKVLHRIIPCNKYLANIRIKQDDTCAFCDEVDSIQHFLLECDNAKLFWMQVCEWLEQNPGLVVQISQEEFLFGVRPTIPDARQINFISIFFKFFIHRQKLFHNGDLPLILFLRELRTKLQIEKRICFLEGKPDKFNCWKRLLTAVG